MKITSLNINRLVGIKNWKNVTPFELERLWDKNLDKVVGYVREKIQDTEDIVFLHEIPYKHFNVDESMLYEKLYARLKSKVEEKNNGEKELVFETSNKLKKEKIALGVSAFVRTKESRWCFSDNYVYSKKDGECNFQNKVIELKNGKINVLAIHAVYDKDFWNDITKYYDKMKNKNTIIIGDLNAYKDKEGKNKEFIGLIEKKGAIDLWLDYRPDTEIQNHPTRYLISENREGNRIDHALASPQILNEKMIRKGNIIIDDEPRNKISGFTDHSAITVVLSI